MREDLKKLEKQIRKDVKGFGISNKYINKTLEMVEYIGELLKDMPVDLSNYDPDIELVKEEKELHLIWGPAGKENDYISFNIDVEDFKICVEWFCDGQFGFIAAPHEEDIIDRILQVVVNNEWEEEEEQPKIDLNDIKYN